MVRFMPWGSLFRKAKHKESKPFRTGKEFLRRILTAQKMAPNTDKWDDVKVKTLHATRETIVRMDR